MQPETDQLSMNACLGKIWIGHAAEIQPGGEELKPGSLRMLDSLWRNGAHYAVVRRHRLQHLIGDIKFFVEHCKVFCGCRW